MDGLVDRLVYWWVDWQRAARLADHIRPKLQSCLAPSGRRSRPIQATLVSSECRSQSKFRLLFDLTLSLDDIEPTMKFPILLAFSFFVPKSGKRTSTLNFCVSDQGFH